MSTARSSLQTLLENDIGDFLTLQTINKETKQDSICEKSVSTKVVVTDTTPTSTCNDLYHDHAFDTENDLSKLIENEKKNLARKCGINKQMGREKSGPRGGVYVPFPMKLHKLLESAKEEGLDHVISWRTHGRAFMLNDPNEFATHIMPTYFRQTKITSFHRQLNLYGFMRIKRGPDEGSYYHELFLRGKPFLCKAMLRIKLKGKRRQRSNTSNDDEPNFYKMSPLGTKRAIASNLSSAIYSQCPPPPYAPKSKIIPSFSGQYRKNRHRFLSFRHLAFKMEQEVHQVKQEEIASFGSVKKLPKADLGSRIAMPPDKFSSWIRDNSLYNKNWENDTLLEERLIDALSSVADSTDSIDW